MPLASESQPGNAPVLPLAGIRVLELTVIFAGPSSTMILGDWGAEVIRIESFDHYSEHTRGPQWPEPGFLSRMKEMRHPLYTYVDWEPGERPWNRYGAFNASAKNKLSVDLDITTASGREKFLALVAQSDVVVENNAPRFLDRLDLGYERLREVKEDIILTRMPAFGLSGPYREFKANGANIDGYTAHLGVRGYRDTDLSEQGTVVAADAITGISAALATVMALIHRRKTGKGQLVEVPMVEAFLACMPEGVLEASMNGSELRARGSRNDRMVPYGCFPCLGSDQWVTLAVRDDAGWVRFCELVEFEDWLKRPDLASLEGRLAHQDEIEARVAGWTGTRAAEEIMQALQSVGIACMPLLDEPHVFEDPHLKARHVFQPLYQEDCGTHLYQAPWWLVNGERPGLRLPPCRLGEHTEIVDRIIGRRPTPVD